MPLYATVSFAVNCNCMFTPRKSIFVLSSNIISAHLLSHWITYSLSFCFLSGNFRITDEIINVALKFCSNWVFTFPQFRLVTSNSGNVLYHFITSSLRAFLKLVTVCRSVQPPHYSSTSLENVGRIAHCAFVVAFWRAYWIFAIWCLNLLDNCG
jgi:hypothetical protein